MLAIIANIATIAVISVIPTLAVIAVIAIIDTSVDAENVVLCIENAERRYQAKGAKAGDRGGDVSSASIVSIVSGAIISVSAIICPSLKHRYEQQ